MKFVRNNLQLYIALFLSLSVTRTLKLNRRIQQSWRSHLIAGNIVDRTRRTSTPATIYDIRTNTCSGIIALQNRVRIARTCGSSQGIWTRSVFCGCNIRWAIINLASSRTVINTRGRSTDETIKVMNWRLFIICHTSKQPRSCHATRPLSDCER